MEVSKKPVRFVSVDFETTINNHKDIALDKHIDRPAADYWAADNEVVLCGYHIHSTNSLRLYSSRGEMGKALLNMAERYQLVLVGINWGFDAPYLWTSEIPIDKFLEKDIILYDLQISEYMITGQDKKFPSMASMSETYKTVHKKTDEVAKFWERGINTPDIPEKLLKDYLKQDLHTTTDIFFNQYRYIRKVIKETNNKNLWRLILSHMKGRMNTCLMEMHPFIVDTKVINELSNELEIKINNICKRAENWYTDIYGKSPKCIKEGGVFSPSVFNHIIHNQILVDVTTQPKMKDGRVVLYKSGPKKGKIRQEKVQTKIPSIGDATPSTLRHKVEWLEFTNNKLEHPFTKTGKSLRCDNDYCSILLKSKIKACYREYLRYYMDYKKYSKIRNTYSKSFVHKLGRRSAIDKLLCTHFNHTATATGRLSSTNPNLQNIP